VVIPDINLLVFAYNEAAPAHVAARTWWEALMTGRDRIALPWAVVFGFVRVVTHQSVLESPLSPDAAMTIVREWFTPERVLSLDPGPRHLDIVETLFRATSVAGNLTTDTHLAALAIEHQCELHSNDADFGRFPGLRWRNPLAA
jgi:toxin-antitoxin system PIN domain toxin